MEKTCNNPSCGKSMAGKRSDAKYCSSACRSKANENSRLGNVSNVYETQQTFSQPEQNAPKYSTPSGVPGYLYQEKLNHITKLELQNQQLSKEAKEWEIKYRDLHATKQVDDALRDADANKPAGALGSIVEGLKTPEGLSALGNLLAPLPEIIRAMKESGNSNPAPTVQTAPVTTDPTKQAIITQLTQAVLSCPDNVTLDKAGTVFTLFLTPGFANWLDEVYNKVIASINQQQTKP